jgi:hypothetical protein
MEEGASGFLRKKLLDASTSGASKMEAEGNDGWDSMDALFESGGDIEKSGGFGTKSWASVYLAATPEQAALLGVPGADEVTRFSYLVIYLNQSSYKAPRLVHRQQNTIWCISCRKDIFNVTFYELLLHFKFHSIDLRIF